MAGAGLTTVPPLSPDFCFIMAVGAATSTTRRAAASSDRSSRSPPNSSGEAPRGVVSPPHLLETRRQLARARAVVISGAAVNPQKGAYSGADHRLRFVVIAHRIALSKSTDGEQTLQKAFT